MRVTKSALQALVPILLATTLAAQIGVAAAESATVAESRFESCQDATLPLGAPDALWEQALQQTDRCQHDAAYLAAAAQWLNEQRRYEEGQLYAERSLMLDPAYVPAWIEFALSQAALGAPGAGVEALLQAKEEAKAQLATAPDGSTTDTALAMRVTRLTDWVSEIDELLSRYSQPAPDVPVRILDAFVGYDSNFYGGPSSGQLELTLPTGPVLLPIPYGLAPQRGFFTGLGITQSGAIQGSRFWHYTVQAQAKALLNQLSERVLSFQGNAERFNRAAGDQYVNVGLAASYLGGKMVTSQVHGTVGYEPRSSWGCQLRLGVEVQLRRYPQSGGLDGSYLGLQQAGVCASGWRWQARVGQDRPKTSRERAGGTQRQIALQLGKSFQLDNQKVLQTQLNLWRQSDQVGYSALLANNAIRRINRGTLRLEYQWNLKSKHVPYVAFEQTLQHSNLTLFKSQNTVIQFGIRGGW